MTFEHYRMLFLETQLHLYYIHSQGYVERFPKAKMTAHGVSAQYLERVPHHHYQRTGYKRDNYIYVIVNKKHYLVKHLVAKYFSRQWEEGSHVLHKDKNPHNCSLENLIIKPRSYCPSECCNNSPIEFHINGEWRRFNSIKEAAEKLHISRSALKRHITYKNVRPDLSILGDTKFRFVEKTKED